QPGRSLALRAAKSRAAALRMHLDAASGRAPRLSLDDPLPPPVKRDTVREAEDRLGFALPPLLCRLWIEIANGGFGPGSGLVGLQGGQVDDASRKPLPDLYLDAIADPAWESFLGEPWPARLVPVCDWGCLHQSAIDCSTPEARSSTLLTATNAGQKQLHSPAG